MSRATFTVALVYLALGKARWAQRLKPRCIVEAGCRAEARRYPKAGSPEARRCPTGGKELGADCDLGLVKLAAFGIEREGFAEFEDLAADLLKRVSVGSMVESLGDPVADLLQFGLFHSARGHRRAANANATGLERRIGIKRNRVLVDG